jgi:hypothetical protein
MVESGEVLPENEIERKLFIELPILCRGVSCEWAHLCGCYDRPGGIESLTGKPCIVEKEYAWELYHGYIKNLGIGPDDFVDRRHVADLVRLEVQIRRCDLYQRTRGVIEMVPRLIHQKSGAVVEGPEVSQALQLQTKLRNDRDNIYKQLLASREAKFKRDMEEGRRSESFAALMANIQEALRKSQKVEALESGEDDLNVQCS